MYFYILLILERKEERERDLLPPECTPTKAQTLNLGMCPDWGLYPQPFGVQDDALTN